MKNINRILNKYILSILLMGGIYSVSNAQQDAQYTHYMYNIESINPAYAGNRGTLSFTGIYRTQWVGLDGAPETLTFSANSPIGEKGVGLGLSFFNDKIGPSQESNLVMDFSYTIPVSEKTKLAFGLKGGANLLDVDFTRLNPDDPTDPDFMNNIDNRLSPIIGVGMYLFGDQWYLGASSPNLIATEHYDDVATSSATEEVHGFIIGGYVFDLSSNTKFKPAVLGKFVTGAPIGLDVSANFLFYDKFSLGAAYRLDAAVSGLIGFQVSDKILVGYAYDYDTTELGNYNSGSHEFLLRFELGTKMRKTVNPRFF